MPAANNSPNDKLRVPKVRIRLGADVCRQNTNPIVTRLFLLGSTFALPPSGLFLLPQKARSAFRAYVREKRMTEEFCGRKKGGTRRPIVYEPLAWAETYPLQWRETGIDLAELAKLRWIEGLSRNQLAERYCRTEFAMQNYFQALRRRQFRITGLSENERKAILLASKNA